MAIVLPKFSRRRLSSGFAAETQPAVNVSLCREDGIYLAGGELMASWRVRRIPVDDISSVEVSVLWHTEGKGDEDLHVHHFHRLSQDQVRSIGEAKRQSLRCQLPASPLSYHGHLIQLRWCLRLRLFLTDGREILAEQPFHLVSPPNPISNSTVSQTQANAGDETNAATKSRFSVKPLVRGKFVTRRLPSNGSPSKSSGRASND